MTWKIKKFLLRGSQIDDFPNKTIVLKFKFSGSKTREQFFWKYWEKNLKNEKPNRYRIFSNEKKRWRSN